MTKMDFANLETDDLEPMVKESLELMMILLKSKVIKMYEDHDKRMKTKSNSCQYMYTASYNCTSCGTETIRKALNYNIKEKDQLSRQVTEYKTSIQNLQSTHASEIRRLEASCRTLRDNAIIQEANNAKIVNKYKEKYRSMENKLNADVNTLKIKLREDKRSHDLIMAKNKKTYEDHIAQLKGYNKFYSEKIENHSKEKKEEFRQDLLGDFDYKKIYSYLVENIREHFESPISFDRIDSPYILKSGHTIDESEFKELYKRKSKDPYDRTKMVDTKTPNLALRNIMELVDFTENIKE